MIPSPPNFTPAPAPQRCSRRSRRTQGAGPVAVGVWAESDVTVAERESVIIPMWLRRGETRVSETRCNPHLRVFLPPCLIRVQYAPNEYSRSCLFCVCVCVCACGWEPMGSIGNYVAFPGESLFFFLSVYPQEHPHFRVSCTDSTAHY